MRLFAILMLALLAHPAAAHEQAAMWNTVGFDQRLDAMLPLETRFSTEAGESVPLADVLGRKPAVLIFNYYDCPNLCSVVLKSAFETLTQTAFGLALGRDFNLIAVSIDPRETPQLAAAKKAEYLQRYKRIGNAGGVHFLTGSAASIEPLARAAGFRYVYDTELQQYAHAAGLVIVTPDGHIARYLFGAQYPAHALRLALVEASHNRIGTLIDQVWLLCFHYDPAHGRYGFAIINALRAGGALVVFALIGYIVLALRRERRRAAPNA